MAGSLLSQVNPTSYIGYLEAVVLSLLAERRTIADINGVDYTSRPVTYSPLNVLEYIEGNTTLDIPRVRRALPELAEIKEGFKNPTPSTYVTQAHWRCPACDWLNGITPDLLGDVLNCAKCGEEQRIVLPPINPVDEIDEEHHAMMNGPRIAQSLPPEYLGALLKAATPVEEVRINSARWICKCGSINTVAAECIGEVFKCEKCDIKKRVVLILESERRG